MAGSFIVDKSKAETLLGTHHQGDIKDTRSLGRIGRMYVVIVAVYYKYIVQCISKNSEKKRQKRSKYLNF